MELLDHMTFLFSIFLKTLHPIFQNYLTNVQSHQQGTSVLFSPYPYQHLLSPVFFVMAILTEVISHCHLDLHFLNDSDTEHISMYLLAICICSLVFFFLSIQVLCPFFFVPFFATDLFEFFNIFWLLTTYSV